MLKTKKEKQNIVTAVRVMSGFVAGMVLRAVGLTVLITHEGIGLGLGPHDEFDIFNNFHLILAANRF